MSWIEKVQNNLIIKTGDGKTYTPGWINARRAVEYNLSEFDFPRKKGTLAVRSEARGMRYTLELHFQGEDHLDVSEAFRISAEDKRVWVMTHPFYGQIFCQPTGLEFDNSGYNITRINGTVVETITDDYPKTSVDPVDRINSMKAAINTTFATSFANNVSPTVADVNEMKANNLDLYNLGSKRVKFTIDAEEYFNAFNNANAAITNATAKPLEAITELQAVVNKPALFADSVQQRISTLIDQVNTLRATVTSKITTASKRLFENNISMLISSMAVASANPQQDDYGKRDDVFVVVEQMLSVYNTFLEDLDGMQTENGGEPDSYIPDADSMTLLNELMNFTIANLFNIALDSKQERRVILEEDSNAVLQTHRFYGLDIDDVNLNKFIAQNNLGLDQYLYIRKGTLLKYYV